MVLRCLTILVLCLAMAGTGLIWNSQKTELVVLTDRSQSVAGQRSKEEEWIREVERVLPDTYEMSVVSFGADTQIETKFEQPFGRFEKEVKDTNTNLEQALRFSSAYFSPDRAKQVFLLSDGQENEGDVMRMLSVLRSQGIRVDAKALESGENSDAQVSKVEIPATIYQDEQFDISVTIDSQIAKKGTLFLYVDQDILSEQIVSLEVGSNTFVFHDVAKKSGIISYRAVLVEDSGGVVQNNQKSAVATVVGQPTILIVEGLKGDARELDKMLQSTSMNTKVIDPKQIPSVLADLQTYDAITMVNVSLDAVNETQVNTLDQYVRVLGRGLVVFGGDNSYALGSYIGSDFEKMLPVESNVRNQLNVPSLALVMIVDKSGSMDDGYRGGVSKMELAKEAMQRSSDLLVEQDELGIIAFDDKTYWVSPLQPATNIDEVQELIGSIRARGGTVMKPSLQEAYKALQESNAAIKHVILLTDGEPADRGFDSIVDEMYQEGITVSGVAIGAEANAGLINYLSEIGGGRFYQTNTFDDIPSIFAKETQLSTKSYLQNRNFYPEIVNALPIIAPYTTGFPELTGFLATIAKPMANVALQSDNGMPILAQWQYGAGQVIAWTSDVKGGWTADYLSWDQGGRFFAGLVSNVLNEGHGQGYVTMIEQGGEGQVMLEVNDMDNSDTKAQVIAPSGTVYDVEMNLEKPGVFSGDVILEEEGAYTVRVTQQNGSDIVNELESGVALGYSDEYDVRRKGDITLLTDITNYSGGVMIDEINELFQTPMDPVKRLISLSKGLMIATILLFVLELILRKLQWETQAQKVIGLCKEKRDQIKITRKKISAEVQIQKQPKQSTRKEKASRRKLDKEDSVSVSEELLSRRKK